VGLMALIGANELKRKMLITVDKQPYAVIEVNFSSPSSRGASTLVRTKLRNLITDAVLDKSFKTNEKFEEPDVVLTAASFLYSDSEGFHFMDEGSYEQFILTVEQLGDEDLSRVAEPIARQKVVRSSNSVWGLAILHIMLHFPSKITHSAF
jgi:elongation factor P